MSKDLYFNLFDQMCRSNGWTLGDEMGRTIVSVPQSDGESMNVVVNEFNDNGGQFCLRLWTRVATTEQFPADQAIAINWQLPYGFLAVKEDMVVMTGTRQLNQTSQGDLTNLITTITFYAAFYKKHYASGDG